jgi:hypothetical protein
MQQPSVHSEVVYYVFIHQYEVQREGKLCLDVPAQVVMAECSREIVMFGSCWPGCTDHTALEN